MNSVDLTDLTEELLTLKQRIPANLSSVAAAIQSPELCGHRLAYDTFRDSLGMCIAPAGTDDWRPITETDEAELRVRLELRCFVSISKPLLKDALLAVMARNKGLTLLKPMPGPDFHLKPEGFSPAYAGAEHV